MQAQANHNQAPPPDLCSVGAGEEAGQNRSQQSHPSPCLDSRRTLLASLRAPLSEPALPASLPLTSAVRELVKKQDSTNVKAIMQLPKMRYVIACTPVEVSTDYQSQCTAVTTRIAFGRVTLSW